LLAPKDLAIRLRLAAALEKKGDWPAAMAEYRQAAAADRGLAGTLYDAGGRTIHIDASKPDPQTEYQHAQERLRQHIASLRAAGKSSEAADLQTRITTAQDAPDVDSKLKSAVQAGAKALAESRFAEAESSFQEAVALAEKMQPQDGRFPEALGNLGTVYARRLDFARASEVFRRQLAATEKLYGPNSPMLYLPLQNLATLAFRQQDFDASQEFFLRAVAVQQKAYGEHSQPFADSLSLLGAFYLARKDYPKAEPPLLRSQAVYDEIFPQNASEQGIPLAGLCALYERWSKPERAESCQRRMAAIAEKNFGAETPYLVPILTSQAQALRQLGRNDEAAQLEKRVQAIQSQSAQAAPANQR